MCGTGRRFIEAGYKTPKPLIEIDGKAMIEYVVELFPGESNFIFICNSEHLKKTRMAEILRKIAPQSNIIAIEPHTKGPVYSVAKVFDLINDEDEAIVNYCDFFTYWDYQDFLNRTRARNADGAIVAYKGFHPHMLGNTHYAFIRDKDQWMLEIKEKEPFTSNRMLEYASNGTYYFRSGKLLKRYFQKLIDLDRHVKGEYYVSLVYNLLVEEGLKVSIYEIQHMLQWGTPQDLKEQVKWSHYFKSCLENKIDSVIEKGSITLIPMAGRGVRFAQEGYSQSKPLIPISGFPMVSQAVKDLPQSEKHVFVCLKEHLVDFAIEKTLKKEWPNCLIIPLEKVTEGQAATCELGLKGQDLGAPLLIGACDNGGIWNQAKYLQLRSDPSVDIIVWSFRHHPSAQRNPHMYGWLKTNESGDVLGVSVKKPISTHPENDHAIVGTFYFRSSKLFLKALEQMYRENRRINGEFYVDSCVDVLIKMGYKAKVFEMDHYVCWGTPNDVKTFEYWQSYFHKYRDHPYRLEKDPKMNKNVIKEWADKFSIFEQEYR
jgi:NDP-sugar pyrophosphorylase family protein